MVFPIGAALAAGSAAAQVFGTKRGKPAPSAFQSMPQGYQNTYNNYNQRIQDYGNQGQLDPSRYVAGLNNTQQNYLQNAGQYGPGNLQPFMDPYNENVINRTLGSIQDQGNADRSRIMGQIGGGGGLSGFSNAATGQYLASNDANTQRAIGDARALLEQRNYQQAQAARQQNLGNMFQAGNFQQGQDQAEVDVNNPFYRLQNEQSLLSGLPGPGAFQQGPQGPARQTGLGQLGNFGSAFLGNQGIANQFSGFGQTPPGFKQGGFSPEQLQWGGGTGNTFGWGGR